MRSLAIVVVAAIAGAFLGFYLSGGRSGLVTTTGSPTRTVTVTVTEANANAGSTRQAGRRAAQRLFETACLGCHSLEPGDWRGDRISLTDLRTPYRAIVGKVTSGGIAMPSFKGELSEQQIRDVAAFVAAETAKRARADSVATTESRRSARAAPTTRER